MGTPTMSQTSTRFDGPTKRQARPPRARLAVALHPRPRAIAVRPAQVRVRLADPAAVAMAGGHRLSLLLRGAAEEATGLPTSPLTADSGIATGSGLLRLR